MEYKPWRTPQSATDWAIYHAAYDDASRRRSARGECGDHIGNKFEAYEFLQRVSPARFEYTGGSTPYEHPDERARRRVEQQFAKLAAQTK